jgi:predicted NUDIX family NTP pyrophosphohydrolase
MARRSGGILLWRRRGEHLEVLLGHPGGPLFARRDAGVWSVLKGEIEPGEDALAVARREFQEETDHPAPDGEEIALGEIRQRGGKVVEAWALEGDLDPAQARSNTFRMEWPPRSGRFREYPEIDRVEWFGIDDARDKVNPAQVLLLERLVDALAERR